MDDVRYRDSYLLVADDFGDRVTTAVHGYEHYYCMTHRCHFTSAFGGERAVAVAGGIVVTPEIVADSASLERSARASPTRHASVWIPSFTPSVPIRHA